MKNAVPLKLIPVFLAVVLIVLAAVFFSVKKSPQNKEQTPAEQPKPVLAAKGELTPGFPKELILDAKAKLDQSFAVNYNQNLNQYSAMFSSGMSMTKLFALYKDYFAKNGWTITNQITKYPTSRGLYAKKDNTDASVAVIDQTKSRQVVVSYVVK